MRDNQIGGLPVVEGPKRKIVGNVSMRDIRYLLLKPDLFSNFRYSKTNFEPFSPPILCRNYIVHLVHTMDCRVL